MKFNKHISRELQELLTSQLEEYIKVTLMTKKELRAVRGWVKDGHSVYESMSGAFYDELSYGLKPLILSDGEELPFQ